MTNLRFSLSVCVVIKVLLFPSIVDGQYD